MVSPCIVSKLKTTSFKHSDTTMEVSTEINIAATGSNMYGKVSGKFLTREKNRVQQKKKIRKHQKLNHTLLRGRWKMKCKLTLDVAGYVPNEFSRFISFFLVHGWNIEASALFLQSKLYPDPREVLEIILKASFHLKNKILIK